MHGIDAFRPEAVAACLAVIVACLGAGVIERCRQRVKWCRWYGERCPRDGRCPKWLDGCRG